MSDHEKSQTERSSESAPDELSDQDLTTVAGGAQVPSPRATSLKAGASEVLMETVTMTCEVKASK